MTAIEIHTKIPVRDRIKDTSAQIAHHEREAARLNAVLDGLLEEVRKRPSRKGEPQNTSKETSPAMKAARTKKARKKDKIKPVNDSTLGLAKDNLMIYLRKYKGGHVATEIYKSVKHGQDTLRRAIKSLADEGLIKSEQIMGANHAKTTAWSAVS